MSDAVEYAREFVAIIDDYKSKRIHYGTMAVRTEKMMDSPTIEMVCRALLAAVEGSALTPRDERDVTDNGWQPIETAPRDGRAVLVQGSMYVHYMLGAKFPMLPYGWRPDTPQTAWVITGWQPLHEAPTEPRPSLSGREGEK